MDVFILLYTTALIVCHQKAIADFTRILYAYDVAILEETESISKMRTNYCSNLKYFFYNH
jgi:hypothetical protein